MDAALLADGVHIGLPIATYVADPALSGGKFLTLLTEPGAITFDSDANPLYIKPDKSTQRAQLRGSASHTLLLEGPRAYAARYCVKPAGVLCTQDDLKDFLRAAKARLIAKLGVEKLSREESKPFLLTGDSEDLAARCRAHDSTVQIWDGSDPRELLTESDDAYVKIVERFLRKDLKIAPYITGGLPELTFVWTDDGVRFKCRPDYLTATTVLDAKHYGRPPHRGMGLKKHCVRTAAYSGADLQAVHNHGGVMTAARRYAAGKLDMHLHGAAGINRGPGDEAERLAKLLDTIANADDEPVFRWLFTRMAGAPTSIVLPFRKHDAQWGIARDDIDAAIDTFKTYRDTCGDGIWTASLGEQEIEDFDWPLGIMREQG